MAHESKTTGVKKDIPRQVFLRDLLNKSCPAAANRGQQFSSHSVVGGLKTIMGVRDTNRGKPEVGDEAVEGSSSYQVESILKEERGHQSAS